MSLCSVRRGQVCCDPSLRCARVVSAPPAPPPPPTFLRPASACTSHRSMRGVWSPTVPPKRAMEAL
eukprot:6395426-Pyramimonas_sp.AAC.1